MRKRACDACHRRKIQCDEARPRCNWCMHHDSPCTFDRAVAAKKPSKHTRKSITHEDLGERLNRIEQVLAQRLLEKRHSIIKRSQYKRSPQSNSPKTEPSPTPPALTTASQPQGVSFGKLHFAGYYLGNIVSYNGIPFFSNEAQEWIESRTGERIAFSTLFASGPPWHATQAVNASFLAGGLPSNFDLPDRQVVNECISLYNSTPFKLIFPFIDTVLFNRTLDLAYEPWSGPPSLKPITAKACLFAFCSVLSSCREAVSTVPAIDSEDCAVKAQYLLPQVLQETSLPALQTIFMICMNRLFAGQLQIATYFHSLACRLVYMLGGHTLSDPDVSSDQSDEETGSSWRVKVQLRKLFWLCYTFDKDISLRTGQPPSMEDEYCDLTLPDQYLEIQYNERDWESEAASLDDTICLLPGDLRLSILKSKVYKALYSAEALRKSDAELLRDIRKLDDELERWRVSLPEKYQPILTFPEQGRRSHHTRLSTSMQISVIHFEYYHLFATIHRASGRCRAWARGEVGELKGISSSLALSVEASRSTLFYLRTVIQALYRDAFWMTVFYPVNAILDIFCNILLNPLNPRAVDDLELLSSTPELIKSMRMRHLTVAEIEHMQLVDNFVAEFIKLGNSSITRAFRERSQHLHCQEDVSSTLKMGDLTDLPSTQPKRIVVASFKPVNGM